MDEPELDGGAVTKRNNASFSLCRSIRRGRTFEKQSETFSAGLLLGAFEEFSKVDRWVTTKASDERPRGSVGLVEEDCVLEGQM
jgi:hypothetical protein